MRSFRADLIPKPPVLGDLPPRMQHLDVEIGAGQGLHAIQRAQRFPERTLIAIERTHTKFSAFQTRLAHHPDLRNLVPVHGDAVAIIAHHIADRSVENVFLLYPNPYPKRKHANLRWPNSPFMECLRAKMTLSGKLWFATNLADYAEEASLKFPANWGFRLDTRERLHDARLARTHFEKKYLERGEACWNLVFSLT